MAFSIKDQKDSNVDNEVVSTAVLTDNAIVRGDGGSRGVQTSGVFVDDSNNITGANELTLGSTLTIANDTWLRFLNYAGTGYLNVLRGNVDDEVDVGVQLNIGSIEAEEDAGAITLFDMPVSDAPTAGDEMSATLKIDANNVFKIGAKADSAGGIDSQFIQSYGAIFRHITTVNAATYDLLASDDILNVTYTATGAVTSLTLPTAQCVSGRVIVIKDAGGLAGTNNITIATEGAEKIDGLDTLVINNNYNSVTLYSDGTNWFAI